MKVTPVDFSGIRIGETLNSQMLYLANVKYSIKLGTSKGSAFIFCGPGSKLWKEIENLNVLYKEKAEGDILKSQKRRDTLLSSFPSLESYSLKKCKDSNYTYFGSWEEYQKVVEDHFRKLTRYQKRIEKMKDALKKRVSFRDRVIKSAYQSINEENTVILLIEGNECGEAWDYYEYVNGVSKEDQE